MRTVRQRHALRQIAQQRLCALRQCRRRVQQPDVHINGACQRLQHLQMKRRYCRQAGNCNALWKAGRHNALAQAGQRIRSTLRRAGLANQQSHPAPHFKLPLVLRSKCQPGVTAVGGRERGGVICPRLNHQWPVHVVAVKQVCDLPRCGQQPLRAPVLRHQLRLIRNHLQHAKGERIHLPGGMRLPAAQRAPNQPADENKLDIGGDAIAAGRARSAQAARKLFGQPQAHANCGDCHKLGHQQCAGRRAQQLCQRLQQAAQRIDYFNAECHGCRKITMQPQPVWQQCRFHHQNQRRMFRQPA